MNEFGIRRVAENASWLIGVKIAQSVIAFIINLFTARYLGPSNYGLISYAASLVAFVTPIMQLGITNIIVRELVVNSREEGKILGSALVLNVVSAFFCVIGVTLFGLFANAGETETIIVCVLYSILLLFQAVEVVNYWFQARLLSRYTSITSFCVYIFVAAYKVFLLITGKNVYWFAISNALDVLLIAVSLFILYRKLGGQHFEFSKETARKLFHKGKYYIVSSMMVTIFAQTDRIMLKHMMSTAEVGFYSAATTCAGITSFVFVALIDSFRPMIFDSKEKSETKFEDNVSRLYSIVTYLCLAQCVLMTIFAPLFIDVIYGKDYGPAINALQIVVWYTTFSYYGSVRNIWILSENKQKYLWIINLSGAIANIILNYILIPVCGVNGAAIASLITQIFTNIIVGFIIRPIRFNNTLMLRGLNPKYIKEIWLMLRNEKKV